MRFVLLNRPDAIEEVLVRQNRNFVKNVTEPVWWALLGNGLLISEGDFWIRQRRLMQPVFHRQRIAEYGETMVAFTQRRLDTWRDGDVRDMQAEMMQLTLEVVALLRAQDADGSRMTDRQLRDEVMTLFLAGHVAGNGRVGRARAVGDAEAARGHGHERSASSIRRELMALFER